jgi:hypothetical protein
MWIPKPIYDHAPLFWLLLGALFLAGAIYLNFSDGLRAAYYVFAVFCFAHAVWPFPPPNRHGSLSKTPNLSQRKPFPVTFSSPVVAAVQTAGR